MGEENYTYDDYKMAPDPSHCPMYLARVLEVLKPMPRGSTVLDAGCGGGDFSAGLAEAGFRVFGSDLSPSGIAAAKARGVGEFAEGSIYEPLGKPFGLERFDAVVCIEVIEHLYSPKLFAQRAFEALPSGGVAIISTPYWGYLKNIVLAVTGRMDRSLTALWEGGHIKHFSRASLSELMIRQGFEVLDFKGCGEGWRDHAPYLWNGMLMTFRKPFVAPSV